MTQSLNDSLIATLAQAGGAFIDAPSVMSAAVLLELSGEDIRGRLCSFSGPDGEEFCLRPDMTAPIALMAAQSGGKAARYRYSGPVFRFPAHPGEPLEFIQTGFEWGGEDSTPAKDAEALTLVVDALREAGVEQGALHFGDSALYNALIDALGLSDPWPERLKKAFKRRHGPKALIDGKLGSSSLSPLAKALAGLPEDEARAAVEEVFTATGISPVGGRDAGDIAARLTALSQAQSAGDVPKGAGDVIRAFLDISGPARKAGEAVAKLAKKAGISLDEALNAYNARLDALETADAVGANEAMFSATFGRRFDYYDGLVFEIVHPGPGGERAMVSGGRYDRLIHALSDGQADATAFGVAMRPDRIGEAARMEGST